MSGKFHVSPNGKAGECTATVGQCPYGGADSHFNNLEEAEQSYANKRKDELLSSQSKNSREERLAKRLTNKQLKEKIPSLPKEIRDELNLDADDDSNPIEISYMREMAVSVITQTGNYEEERKRLKFLVDEEKELREEGYNLSKERVIRSDDGRYFDLDHYEEIKETEKEITSQIIGLADSMKTENEDEYFKPIDLAFRLKTPASSMNKIIARKKNNNLGEMNDIVRYTYLTDEKNYAKNVEKTIEHFESQGYKMFCLTNKWNTPKDEDGNTPYRGVHLNFMHPNGTTFEVQLHTQESHNAKMEAHGLYEKNRMITDRPLTKEEKAEGFAPFGKLNTPNGINKIQDVDIEQEVRDKRNQNLGNRLIA